MKAYLDNAATTPIDPKVYEAMEPYLREYFGNPSSTHSFGREVRSAVERARKTIAEILNAAPGEIYFTSSGTEADNTFLTNQVRFNGIKHIITTPIEHHAVLHVAESLEKTDGIHIHYLTLDENGDIDYNEVADLLAKYPNAMVSLMEANNEIGNIIDIVRVGEICAEYNVVFHSDTVQSLGYLPHDLKNSHINCIVGSAHKFHGPKGIGLMYLRKGTRLEPYILGGGQERSMRAGTENVYGIIGLAKALELAHTGRERKYETITRRKKMMIELLQEKIPAIEFNGLSGNINQSLSTIISLRLPPSDANDLLLFNLDLKGVSVSGGSACNSGASVGSHVINALGIDPDYAIIRFSISRMTTDEEVLYAVNSLADLYTVSQTT
jgi:cysteine desulfurase